MILAWRACATVPEAPGALVPALRDAIINCSRAFSKIESPPDIVRVAFDSTDDGGIASKCKHDDEGHRWTWRSKERLAAFILVMMVRLTVEHWKRSVKGVFKVGQRRQRTGSRERIGGGAAAYL
jgi:hypothetical protein